MKRRANPEHETMQQRWAPPSEYLQGENSPELNEVFQSIAFSPYSFTRVSRTAYAKHARALPGRYLPTKFNTEDDSYDGRPITLRVVRSWSRDPPRERLRNSLPLPRNDGADGAEKDAGRRGH